MGLNRLILTFSVHLLFWNPSSTTQTVTSRTMIKSIQRREWIIDAELHRAEMLKLIYPQGSSQKARQHNVSNHPIYNFIHRYYNFAATELIKFSPGPFVQLQDVHRNDIEPDTGILNSKFSSLNDQNQLEYNTKTISTTGCFSIPVLNRTFEILKNTLDNKPNFRCFGLHEWAMLYTGNNGQLPRHQEGLSLRVSHKVIDEIVQSNTIQCTHYDAFRFFHPEAKEMNSINPIIRKDQENLEQPACIHANMDLFKYAYQIYPLIPGELLRKSLVLAVAARKVDMRASPYDVGSYEGCESPLCIETTEGKRQYVIEQGHLATEGATIRLELLSYYEKLLNELLNGRKGYL